MLTLRAVACAVAAVALSAYVQRNGVPASLLHPREQALAELQSHAPTTTPLLVGLGSTFFVLATLASAVACIQSLAAAYARYTYVPVGTPPLGPAGPETHQQQQQQQQATTTAAPAARQQQPEPVAQRPPRARSHTPPQLEQPQETAAAGAPRDVARRRALEAQQAALDARAAELAAEQAAKRAAEEAARQARREAAAAAAAAQEAAMQAEYERRLAAWRVAVQQQRGMAAQASVASNVAAAAQAAAAAAAAAAVQAAAAAPTPPAAAAQQQAAPAEGGGAPGGAPVGRLAADRLLRQEQDRAFQESLARDAQKKHASGSSSSNSKQEQQLLQRFKRELQESLPAEPPAAAQQQQEALDGGADSSGSGGGGGGALTVRVRLPSGARAIRRFRRTDSFESVLAFVACLPEMPLLAPGSWALAASFPRTRVLPAAGSVWRGGGAWAVRRQQLLSQVAADALAPGEWWLEVRQLEGPPLRVRASADSHVWSVKEQVQEQTGLQPSEQRLIFSGRIIHSSQRLSEAGVEPGSSLQLAPRVSSSGGGSSSSSGGGGGGGAGVGEGAGASSALSSSSDAHQNAAVVVASSVADLDQVADGAQQLALFVEVL